MSQVHERLNPWPPALDAMSPALNHPQGDGKPAVLLECKPSAQIFHRLEPLAKSNKAKHTGKTSTTHTWVPTSDPASAKWENIAPKEQSWRREGLSRLRAQSRRRPWSPKQPMRSLPVLLETPKTSRVMVQPSPCTGQTHLDIPGRNVKEALGGTPTLFPPHGMHEDQTGWPANLKIKIQLSKFLGGVP